MTRAARVLWIHSRREALGWLAGGIASPFRGGGIEFEELRPYVPSDDVRAIDWNATARTGTPWVKRLREERAHTVLLALDVSASMEFGTAGRAKRALAAEAAALVAAAAGRAGDRVGFLAFADGVQAAIAPRRGATHTWRIVRAALDWGHRPQPARATQLASAARWALDTTRRRSIVVLLSDFRDAALLAAPRAGAAGTALAEVGRRHDLVAALVEDRRERALVAAGGVRFRDAETGGRAWLPTGRRQRARYAAAAEAHRRALARRLRTLGADLVHLDTAVDPLTRLLPFFRARTRRTRGRR